MIGEYVRFTSAELDRAIIDPQWARVHADALLGYDVEDETDDGEGGKHALRVAHRPLRCGRQNANGVYPAPWDGTEADWPETWYAELTTFFAAAAAASDAIISFLD